MKYQRAQPCGWTCRAVCVCGTVMVGHVQAAGWRDSYGSGGIDCEEEVEEEQGTRGRVSIPYAYMLRQTKATINGQSVSVVCGQKTSALVQDSNMQPFAHFLFASNLERVTVCLLTKRCKRVHCFRTSTETQFVI